MINTIEFPALGLSFEIDRIAFSLLGKNVYWYGILIGLGVFLAVWYCVRRIGVFGFNADLVYDVLIWALPAAIVGARLYYVAFEWSYYSQHPADIIAVWKGGLAIYGGVIGALIAVSICCKKYRLNIAAAFDVAALGLLIGQIIGRWGNFINGEAHGTVTDSLFGMVINGEGPFHPTFLYESIWNLIGLILLHIISEKAYRFRGQLFLFYLIWYGVGRSMIEGLRTDSLYIGSTGIRASQMLALITAVIGLVLMTVCLRKSVKTIGQLWDPHADPRSIRIDEKNIDNKESIE